jgi:CHAT domain-containing protein/tetratricopeptide (TPR) repeat protein
MKSKHGAAALGMALLIGCARHTAVPDGTVVIDEAVTLSRVGGSDTAMRELTVHDDTIFIATVDERLTDVRLALSATRDGKPLAATEVENHLFGAGIEVATLTVPEGAHLTVTLSGAPSGKSPGTVGLHMTAYGTGAARGTEYAPLIAAHRAWSEATSSRARPASFRKTGVARMDQAIAALHAAYGDDAALTAHARLVKARALQYFKLDPREARADARRAADAFAKLSTPDALFAARANYVEALALDEMSTDPDAVDPGAEEAIRLARTLLETLAGETSPFGPIEKARAISSLGTLDLDAMRTDDATRRFEQARALFESAGDEGGARDMLFLLPTVLVEQGRFAEAAKAYDPLRGELELITDPELRVKATIAVARSESLSGRSDEAVPLLLEALPYARDHQVQMQLATVLESLGYIYTNRGDLQQAAAFYDEALDIMRRQKDGSEYVFALAAAADSARVDGNLDRAVTLAEEAVRRSQSPIAKARTPLQLAFAYRARHELPRAIAMLREGLAVDLGDPHHHAHTDLRVVLAQCLTELPDGTAADLAEAARQLKEALDTSIKVHDVARQILTYRHLGHLAVRRGRDADALHDFDRALLLARELRARSASTEVGATMLHDEQYAFRGYLEIIFANAARRTPGTLADASRAELAAFRRLEDARRASFGALRVGSLDAATNQHVDALLQEMAQKSLSIVTLLDGKRDPAGDAGLHGLQLDMSRLHAELDNIRWSAAARSTREAQGATQAWRPLAPGTAQLSYVLAEKHVYVLVRDDAGVHMTALAPSRDDLETQLADFSRLDVRNATPEVERQLEAVSAVLLPPGLVPANTRALEIVAEGRIASVPFAALRSPTDPQRRLVDTHDVAMVTSMFAVDEAPRQKAARPYRFVALASGHGTWRAATADPLPKLRVATKEIEVAAALFTAHDPGAKIKLLTGADGNATALQDAWAGGADVVHFATHALADLRQPIASLLVLPATDAAGRGTYLTAGQVQAWRGDTELVFLSACESAIGPPQFAAGMPGLQRAFLRAGARGVIATLAPIEDVLAQQFAADFYSRYTQGMPAARALSETQRAWLRPAPGLNEADLRRRRITALSHAYFTG